MTIKEGSLHASRVLGDLMARRHGADPGLAGLIIEKQEEKPVKVEVDQAAGKTPRQIEGSGIESRG